ncbi:SMI1/KNR4 family protein [Sphingomonas sp. R1]|uniref:SMI1/KNR4 family protein n=1 Tax=Sphingomonas sp. R1 TaxID=399176 RepID=UPI002224FADA|nr:SMI1/KNR4 family protein [Sphingomonas sp. R1]UYY77158.1 SMI1/KNR4 family protein [Sphingomonas sp. R1]
MPVSIPTMPQPTEDELLALAAHIGQSLPLSYIQFVMLHDGAKPGENVIKTSDNEVGVSRFIPVREAAALSGEIEGFPSSAIAFAEDDCGNYFYIAPSNGAVYFWDHELEGVDERMAEDASDFMAKLSPFDASTLQLRPGQVRSAWIDPSFKPEF